MLMLKKSHTYFIEILLVCRTFWKCLSYHTMMERFDETKVQSVPNSSTSIYLKMIPRQNFQQLHQQQQGILRRTVRFSIENARTQFKQKEFAESILNYIAVLKNQSNDIRLKYLDEYLVVLRAYLYEKINDTYIKDILQLSSSIYGSEFRFLRVEAEYHFQRGKFLKSLEVFEKSKNFAKTNLERLTDFRFASTSVENIRSQLFDAWHWRMINDAKRNKKFAAAMESAIKEKKNALVLDIGCGSGIYSVIAARLNKNCTFACDQNEVMCKIAQETFKFNAVEVKLFEMHSTKLMLPSRCDILITETVDSAIFGERIVDTILDAKERLLSQDAIVIPNKATAIFSLIESEDIARENLFETDKFALISNCCNLPSLEGKRIIRAPTPYNCSYLNELPNGYRLLSIPTEGLTVDFNNVHQLKRIKNDKFLTEVIIRATDKGLASAVCVWFRLNLFHQIEICTEPRKGYSWQQSIFPFYPYLEVFPGYTLRFEVYIKDSGLACQPIGTEMTIKEMLIRAPLDINIITMNDKQIRHFFRKAADPAIYSQILDCTDLLLGEDINITTASTQSVFRYIDRNTLNLDNAVCQPGGAILFWPFSFQGNLVDNCMTTIIQLRYRSPNTTLIPCQIRLKGCLISSTQLCARSRLLYDPDEREATYQNVDMSIMDSYHINHYHEIQRTLPLSDLSNDVEIFLLNFQNEKEEQLSNYVKQLTKADKNECVFTCNKEGNCHAILYWFEIVDPSGNELDLRRETETHLPSAYILPKPKNLKKGDQLEAEFSLLHGNVMFHCVKDVLFL